MFRLTSILILTLVWVGAEFSAMAQIDFNLKSQKTEIETTTGFDLGDGRASIFRTSIAPTAKASFGKRWRAEARAALEWAGSSTGLGTETTFSSISRPLQINDDMRLSLDKFKITHSFKGSKTTIGKQVFAFGVLDGLQVTDRFDPVRRRDAIFSEWRPERLARWGLRQQWDWKSFDFDFAFVPDGTVNQLARLGDTFEATAPRFRAGLDSDAVLPSVSVNLPRRPTVGGRVSKTFGATDVSVVAFTGPDTEHVVQLNESGATLEFPNRKLVGVNAQHAVGDKVLRMEVAYIPDQPINIADSNGVSIDQSERWLAGVGVDWSTSETFFNAQIGVDHLVNKNETRTRPQTDVLMTLKAQRGFANERAKASLEYIGTLSDGDGAIRPALSWQLNDSVTVAAGVDYVWGDPSDLIGQFEDTSRTWIKVKTSF